MCEARPGPPRDVRQAVPSEATCNAYVARCLARAAMAFLRDVEAEDAAAGSGCGRRLVVVDVGAGHAALTWLLSQAFLAASEPVGSVLLLATDFHESLLEERSRLEAFRPLLLDPSQAQRVAVDFCALDLCSGAASRDAVRLLHAGVSLEDHLSSEPCCFFYVCGYVFDSLPVDLHVFFPTDGPADSAELLVDAQAPNRALRAGPRRSAVGLMERYAHDEDLRDLARGLLDASGGLALRAMPVAATSAFRRLQALACGDEEGASWAVVVLDEPLDIEDVAQGLPEITPRPGAFALAVDFAALDAAFRVVSGAEVLTWSSARALEGVSSQTMICTGGRSFPHLAGALQEGLVGPLSAYDYLIVVTAARQLACRSGARPPASQARDRAVVERVGGDRLLRVALGQTAEGEVREWLHSRSGDLPLEIWRPAED